MKRLTLFLAAIAIFFTTIVPADAAVRVRGYYRKNGTYVQPHYRSNPDGNPYNNWSTYPNINPYTGKQGTKHIPGYPSISYDNYWVEQNQANIERARYWKQQGYNFDPDWMSAYQMDVKVKDIERAKYWKQIGYNFDPDWMSAYQMDVKVKDIERAKYWKQIGYNFDPNWMSAYQMDVKVKELSYSALR